MKFIHEQTYILTLTFMWKKSNAKNLPKFQILIFFFFDKDKSDYDMEQKPSTYNFKKDDFPIEETGRKVSKHLV